MAKSIRSKKPATPKPAVVPNSRTFFVVIEYANPSQENLENAFYYDTYEAAVEGAENYVEKEYLEGESITQFIYEMTVRPIARTDPPVKPMTNRF